MRSNADIAQMGRRTKRKWVQQLDKLRKAFNKEKEMHELGIKPISEIFERLPTPPRTPATTRAGRRTPARKAPTKTKQSTLSWKGQGVTITKGTQRKEKKDRAERIELSRNYINSERRTQGTTKPQIITPDKEPKTSSLSFGDAPRPPE